MESGPSREFLDEDLEQERKVPDWRKTYLQFLNEIHTCSYAFGVHKSLQHGIPLPLEDITRAMRAFMDYAVEIDVSDLVEPEACQRGSLLDHHAKINASLQNLLRQWFDWLPGTECHYYFRGSRRRKPRRLTASFTPIATPATAAGKPALNTSLAAQSDALRRPSGVDELASESGATTISTSNRSARERAVPPSSLADSINLPNEEAEEETDSECSDDDLDTPLEPLPTPTYSTAPGETCSDVTSEQSQASSYAPEFHYESGSDVPHFLRMEAVYLPPQTHHPTLTYGNYYGSSYLPKPMLIVPIVHPQQKPAMASTSPHPSAPSPGTLSPVQGGKEPAAEPDALEGEPVGGSFRASSRVSSPTKTGGGGGGGSGGAGQPASPFPTTLPDWMEAELKTHRNYWATRYAQPPAPNVKLRLMVSTIPQQMFEVSRNDFKPSREILNRKMDEHTPVDVQNRTRFSPSAREYWAVRPITANRPPDGNDMYLAEHSLPLRIAKTMQKCKKVIQSLVSRKVLATYLARPIDYLNIRLVLGHIRNLPRKEYEEVLVTLDFVDRDKGVRLFSDQLAESSLLSAERVRGQGSQHFFVVTDPGPTGDEASPTEHHASIRDEAPQHQAYHTRGGHTDQFHARRAALPYWLIVVWEGQAAVRVILFSPRRLERPERQEALGRVQRALQCVTRRVNQLVLLASLHETHLADDLMVPTRWKPEVNPEPHAPPATHSRFKPMEFECDLVQSIRLSLLPRVGAPMVLSHLMGTVFDPIVVTNRINTCVYCTPATQAIYYLHLWTSAENFDSPDSGSCLVLDMYGVCEPQEEVVRSLRAALLNKVHQATLVCVGEYAHRNAAKISGAELEWIKSQKREAKQFYPVPDWLDVATLFAFLREGVGLYATAMNRTDLPDSLPRVSTAAALDAGGGAVVAAALAGAVAALVARGLPEPAADASPSPSPVTPGSPVDSGDWSRPAALSVLPGTPAAASTTVSHTACSPIPMPRLVLSDPSTNVAAAAAAALDTPSRLGPTPLPTPSAIPSPRPLESEASDACLSSSLCSNVKDASERMEVEFLYNTVMVAPRRGSSSRQDSMSRKRRAMVFSAVGPSGKGLAYISLRLVNRTGADVFAGELRVRPIPPPPPDPDFWLLTPTTTVGGGEEVDENDLAELWRTENEEEGGFEDAPESASLADSDVTGLAPLGLETDRTGRALEPTEYRLAVEVFVAGEISLTEDLLKKLADSVNQSVLDCLLERQLALKAGPVQLDNAFVEGVRRIAGPAAELQSPTVVLVREEVSLPLWGLMDLTSDLVVAVKSLHAGLSPVAFTNVSRGFCATEPEDEDLHVLSFDTAAYEQFQYAVGTEHLHFTLFGAMEGMLGPDWDTDHQGQMEDLFLFCGEEERWGRPEWVARGGPSPPAAARWAHRQLHAGPGRRCLLLVQCRPQQVDVLLYNLKEDLAKDILAALGRAAAQVSRRELLLQSALHQKLGLFFRQTALASPFHCPPPAPEDAPSALVAEWPREVDAANLDQYYDRSTKASTAAGSPAAPGSWSPLKSTPSMPSNMSVAQLVMASRRSAAAYRPPAASATSPAASSPAGAAAPGPLGPTFGLMFCNVFLDRDWVADMQQEEVSGRRDETESRASLSTAASPTTDRPTSESRNDTPTSTRGTPRPLLTSLSSTGIGEDTEEAARTVTAALKAAHASEPPSLSSSRLRGPQAGPRCWVTVPDPVRDHVKGLLLAYRVCYKHRREKLAKGLDRLVAAQQERPGHALQTGAHIWHVVQHARIFQKFFSPIVFTDSKEVMRQGRIYELHECQDNLTPAEAGELDLQRRLLKRMVDKAVRYIRTVDRDLQQHPLQLDAVTNAAERSLILRKRAAVLLPSSDRLVYLEPQIVLLTKQTDSGLLSFELGQQDTTFFMNIYVNDVDTPAALEAKGRPLASAEVSKEFVEEVCALRNRLHINALLYDFHLEEFHGLLTAPGPPTSLNIPIILRDILRLNERAPTCSHHRLREEFVHVNVPFELLDADFAGEHAEALFAGDGAPPSVHDVLQAGAGAGRAPAMSFDAVMDRVVQNMTTLGVTTFGVPRRAGPSWYTAALVLGARCGDCGCRCPLCNGASSSRGVMYHSAEHGRYVCLGVGIPETGAAVMRIGASCRAAFSLRLYTLCLATDYDMPWSDGTHRPPPSLDAVAQHFATGLQQTFTHAAKMHKLALLWDRLAAGAITESEHAELMGLAQRCTLRELDPSYNPDFLAQYAPWGVVLAKLLLLYAHQGMNCVLLDFEPLEHYIVLSPSEDLMVAVGHHKFAEGAPLHLQLVRRQVTLPGQAFQLSAAEAAFCRNFIADAAFALWEPL